MRKIFCSGLVTLLITSFLFSGCGFFYNDKVSKNGTITYISLEGGFYGIIADDQTKYDPINLTDDFKKNGLKVSFEGNIREDLLNFHMWGTIIEITSIEKL